MKKTVIFRKSLAIILTLILCLTTLAGCSDTPATGSITLTDQVGREVTLEKIPERIVSGYYISTSTCLALGLKDKLVGIETGSAKRPIYSLVAPELITDAVDVGSAKEFNLEACISADPDLVILPMKAQGYADSLAEAGIPVLVVSPESQKDLVGMINLIAEATGTQKAAEKLTGYYDDIAKEISEKTADLETIPVVFMGGTNSPLSTVSGGMYQSDLIKDAGGSNAGDIFSNIGTNDVDEEQFIAMNPDFIIIPANNMANGYDYDASAYTDKKEFAGVNAVANNQIYSMPVGLESWDSPVPSGMLGTLWTLAVLHPEVYSMEDVAAKTADFYKTFYGVDIDTSLIK